MWDITGSALHLTITQYGSEIKLRLSSNGLRRYTPTADWPGLIVQICTNYLDI